MGVCIESDRPCAHVSCIGKSSEKQSANQEAPAVQIPEEGSGDALHNSMHKQITDKHH